ncbi:MAG: glycosyl transferase [Syntrophus sp. (in: bacteria)]|nr:glycosyl transferase [Syntrophus sp. (in: bacteria)]
MSDQFEFTVIIPTHNRAEILVKCIQALGCQTIPPDTYELIVSDDGSEDDTRDRVKTVAGEVLCPVQYLYQTNQGANKARNQAINRALGRILLFINDDSIATPTMLEQHKSTHMQYAAENVGVLGRVMISPEVPPSLFAKLHLDASYNLWDEQNEVDWRAFYTCNVSVKKRFLMAYGLFDETLRYHEDVELSERLSRHGLMLIYNKKALSYHDHFLTEEGYLRTAGLDGKALAMWHKKSPSLRKELAFFGFAQTCSPALKIKHKLGDILINKATIPFLLRTARFLSKRCEGAALLVYSKVYQALKREAARNELQGSI